MKYAIAIVLLAASLSCNLTSETKKSAGSTNNSTTVKPAATISPAQSTNTTASNDTGLDFLKASVGKTADDIQLFDNKALAPRLEKLLGPDYAAMKKYWQTQSPIDAEQNVLALTGCEAHNCGDNQYLMYIDTTNNNINVFHVKNGKMKEFKEKGAIVLPGRLAKDFENMTENANITK